MKLGRFSLVWICREMGINSFPSSMPMIFQNNFLLLNSITVPHSTIPFFLSQDDERLINALQPTQHPHVAHPYLQERQLWTFLWPERDNSFLFSLQPDVYVLLCSFSHISSEENMTIFSSEEKYPISKSQSTRGVLCRTFGGNSPQHA